MRISESENKYADHYLDPELFLKKTSIPSHQGETESLSRSISPFKTLAAISEMDDQ